MFVKGPGVLRRAVARRRSLVEGGKEEVYGGWKGWKLIEGGRDVLMEDGKEEIGKEWKGRG